MAALRLEEEEAMRNFAAKFAVIIAATGLVACTNVAEKLANVEKTTPTGSAFSTGLFKGYVHQARLEAKEYDMRDAERWTDKAALAARNASVGPEELAKWDLPKDFVGDLKGARGRLVAALAAGAAEKIPGQAARAQVSFDCWVQEQEENIQPDDIRACRGAFEDAMGKTEAALKPMAAAAPKSFIVYFDTDSDKLNTGARSVVSLILDAARKAGAKKVVLAGHTDRAGALTYNDVLSKRRVDSVAAALVAAGLAASVVSKSEYGETRPRVATPDGKAEHENRRVEVRVE